MKIFLHINLSYILYELKKHFEIAVSSILTAEDINDMIHVIVNYRVGICPFNVNKCNVADTLLPHGAAQVS